MAGVHRVAAERPRLDLPDRGQQRDRQVTARGRAGDRGPVGGQQHPRDGKGGRRTEHGRGRVGSGRCGRAARAERRVVVRPSEGVVQHRERPSGHLGDRGRRLLCGRCHGGRGQRAGEGEEQEQHRDQGDRTEQPPGSRRHTRQGTAQRPSHRPDHHVSSPSLDRYGEPTSPTSSATPPVEVQSTRTHKPASAHRPDAGQQHREQHRQPSQRPGDGRLGEHPRAPGGGRVGHRPAVPRRRVGKPRAVHGDPQALASGGPGHHGGGPAAVAERAGVHDPAGPGDVDPRHRGGRWSTGVEDVDHGDVRARGPGAQAHGLLQVAHLPVQLGGPRRAGRRAHELRLGRRLPRREDTGRADDEHQDGGLEQDRTAWGGRRTAHPSMVHRGAAGRGGDEAELDQEGPAVVRDQSGVDRADDGARQVDTADQHETHAHRRRSRERPQHPPAVDRADGPAPSCHEGRGQAQHRAGPAQGGAEVHRGHRHPGDRWAGQPPRVAHERRAHAGRDDTAAQEVPVRHARRGAGLGTRPGAQPQYHDAQDHQPGRPGPQQHGRGEQPSQRDRESEEHGCPQRRLHERRPRLGERPGGDRVPDPEHQEPGGRVQVVAGQRLPADLVGAAAQPGEPGADLHRLLGVGGVLGVQPQRTGVHDPARPVDQADPGGLQHDVLAERQRQPRRCGVQAGPVGGVAAHEVGVRLRGRDRPQQQGERGQERRCRPGDPPGGHHSTGACARVRDSRRGRRSGGDGAADARRPGARPAERPAGLAVVGEVWPGPRGRPGPRGWRPGHRATYPACCAVPGVPPGRLLPADLPLDSVPRRPVDQLPRPSSPGGKPPCTSRA